MDSIFTLDGFTFVYTEPWQKCPLQSANCRVTRKNALFNLRTSYLQISTQSVSSGTFSFTTNTAAGSQAESLSVMLQENTCNSKIEKCNQKTGTVN